MKCFIIAPVNHLDLCEMGNMGSFCLAHLYKTNTAYRDFFISQKKAGRFILLDNGAAENSLVSEDDLLAIANELQPDEVIAPDVLFDYQHTIDNLYSFAPKITRSKIIAVPQASSKQQWIQCYIEMLNYNRVHTLGLSKISVPRCWSQSVNLPDSNIAASRNAAVDYLHQAGLITKPLHLLGAGESWEFASYGNITNVRSTDSCITVLSAVRDIDYMDFRSRRVSTPHDYFDYKLDNQQLALAKYNIVRFKQYLHLL